jgi:zinc protease
VFPGYGYIVAVVEVDPARAREIVKAVLEVAGDLNAKGVNQDELDRAKNPLQTAILESERTNQYWMTVIGKAQEKPEVLDWARSRHLDYQSTTKAEIDALAKAYLAPESASRVIIHPEVAPAAPIAPGPKVAPPPDA